MFVDRYVLCNLLQQNCLLTTYIRNCLHPTQISKNYTEKIPSYLDWQNLGEVRASVPHRFHCACVDCSCKSHIVAVSN